MLTQKVTYKGGEVRTKLKLKIVQTDPTKTNLTSFHTNLSALFVLCCGTVTFLPQLHKAGQTKFTIYHHRVIKFACGRVIIILILKSYNIVSVLDLMIA